MLMVTALHRRGVASAASGSSQNINTVTETAAPNKPLGTCSVFTIALSDLPSPVGALGVTSTHVLDVYSQ